MEAPMIAAVLVGIILQLALTGLIAFGTVQRMVDEQEFHHRLAGLFDILALGGDFHAFGHGLGAGYDGPRGPF